jgi:hypothetical protein
MKNPLSPKVVVVRALLLSGLALPLCIASSISTSTPASPCFRVLNDLLEQSGKVSAQNGRTSSVSSSLFSNAVQYALSAGVNNRATSEGSTSLGIGSSSSARGSFASGVFANAAAEGASSFGGGTDATGVLSAALGTYTRASGVSSMATNVGSEATSDASFAANLLTKATGTVTL